MSRPTADDAMRSITVLRPDEAIHPERALGPDYLRQLVETASQASRTEVSDQKSTFDIDHANSRRTKALIGVLATVVTVSAVSVLILFGVNDAPTSPSTQLTTWRTVDATSPVPFAPQGSTSPPMSAEMTCPSALTCYLLTNEKGFQSYKTSDGGVSWKRLVIPGVVSTTKFSCPSVSTCFAGGLVAEGVGIHSAVLATSDGGATWQIKPFSFAPQIDSINCPSTTTCVMAVGGLNYGPDTVPQEDVYWSVDAGGSWRKATPVPSGLVVSLDCPTVTTCIGLTYVQPAHTPIIESLRTADAGYTWQTSLLPLRGIAFDAPSCSDAMHCIAIVQTVPEPTDSVQGQLVALASADGGQSWQTHNLPANVATDGLLSGLSCPTDEQCWAAILLHQDLGRPQPVITATSDGGDSWQQDPIIDPCKPSGCFTDIQTLQCPASSTCLALADLSDFHLPLVLLTNRPTTGS